MSNAAAATLGLPAVPLCISERALWLLERAATAPVYAGSGASLVIETLWTLRDAGLLRLVAKAGVSYMEITDHGRERLAACRGGK